MSLAALVATWREEAGLYRRRGLEDAAVLVESLTDELEAYLRSAAHETVTLTEAAEVGGYRYDSLSKMLREGKIENVGEKNRPRIRRMDIPVKPGCGADSEGVPVLHVETGRARGLETSVERRRVRLQRGGDAS